MGYSLSFSKAVFVVIFISDKKRQEQREYLSTKEISEILNIPKPTLVKILKSLTNKGIVETKEGKSGGIRLAKSPAKIKVLDVFNAIEEGKQLFHTSFDIFKGKRPDKAQKLMSNMFKEAEDDMKATLANKTIEEILTEMD
jgi:Rrf2 family protein